MTLPKYLRDLDKASASLNPFLFILSLGLAMADASLALQRPDVIDALTAAALSQPGDAPAGPISQPELMAQLGYD